MVRSAKPALSDMYTMPRRTRWSVRSPVTSSPPKRMFPRHALISPISVRSSVVLPAPFAPSSTTVSCSPTLRSTPHSTRTLPSPASRPAISSSAEDECSGGILASKKDLDHTRIPDRVGEHALENLPACVHHDDAVGDLVDEAHQVLDHEQRDAGMRQLLELVGDALELGRIEAGRELIHEQQPRAGGKGAGEVEHFLLRAVELGRRPACERRKLERGEQRIGIDRPVRMAAVRDGDLHILAHAERQERLRHLKGAVDAEMHEAVRGKTRDRPALEMDLPGFRAIEAGDDVNASRLAGTVRTHEPENLPRLEIEIELVERPKATEALDEALHGQERLRLRGH